MLKGFISTLALLSIAGCSVSTLNTLESQKCSSTWYSQVDKEIITGDDQGHGPDIGSLEWKSVIQWRLGLRNNPAVPDSSADAWCGYIDDVIKQSRE